MPFLESLFKSETTDGIVIRIILIIICTHGLAFIVRKRLSSRKNQKLYSKFLDNMIIFVIYLFGIIMVVHEFPIFESAFGNIVAGSGIAALAISLAAQESLGNAVNGIVLSISKPFEVGDRIKLVNGNITGFVEDITLRHTVIRTFLNSRIIIPNSVINKDLVENSNYLDVNASGFVDITIPHDANLDLAESIIAKVAGEHPNFVDKRDPNNPEQPKVMVYVRAITVYGIELRTSVLTNHINTSFVTCSDVRREIIHQFREAGISFAKCEVAPPFSGSSQL